MNQIYDFFYILFLFYKVNFLILLVCLCVGKKWLFWFFERWLVCWKNQMCHLRVGFFTLSDNGSFTQQI